MAFATSKTLRTQVLKPVEATIISGFTLQISVQEAAALMAVLGMVGGTPQTTPRGFTENVFDALKAAGAVWPNEDTTQILGYSSLLGKDSSIWFAEGSLDRFKAIVEKLSEQQQEAA